MTWEYKELYKAFEEEKYKKQKPFIDEAYKFIESNNAKKLTDGVFRFQDWDIYPNKLYCRNFKTKQKMSLESFYKML